MKGNKKISEGKIIVTTECIIKEAVKEHISGLYDDVSDFHNNRYISASDREFEQISEQQKNDISDYIIDYILTKKNCNEL